MHFHYYIHYNHSITLSHIFFWQCSGLIFCEIWLYPLQWSTVRVTAVTLTVGYSDSFCNPRFITVLIGYFDYLGTRPKNSHRPIIVTGR